jgi:hypothetical protein
MNRITPLQLEATFTDLKNVPAQQAVTPHLI